MEASSPIAGKAHRCTWAKDVRGFEQLGLTTLPSVASGFAGRPPATPRSASWPPRRVLWRIPSKFPPFSRSFAVPRARKGGLQARLAHQKAFSSRDLQGCKGEISTLAFLYLQSNLSSPATKSASEAQHPERPGLGESIGEGVKQACGEPTEHAVSIVQGMGGRCG